MRRFVFLVVVLALSPIQDVFADEFLDLPSRESVARPEAKQTSNDSAILSKSSSSTSGTVGFSRDKLWRIIPGFEFRPTYDSNVNREPPHQRNEDIIFHYIPSVDIRRKGTRLDVATGYQMDFQEYLRDPDQSGFNHLAKTHARFTGNRLKVGVDERFGWLKAYASSEQSERRTILVNDFRPEISYRFTPKFSIATVYQNYLFHYRESALRESSYMINDIGGRLYYHMTPKLDLYLHSSGNTIDYYRSGTLDSTGYTILAGAIGKAARKVILNLQTGFRGAHYDDSSINSFNGLIAQGAIQYRLTSKIDASLLLKRDKQESVYRNTGWYQADMVGTELNYRISRHVVFGVHSSVQQNSYPRETTEGTLTKKRRDYVLETGTQLKWKPFRHLTLSSGYGFRQRASNFDNTFDYINHTVDLSIAYQFA